MQAINFEGQWNWELYVKVKVLSNNPQKDLDREKVLVTIKTSVTAHYSGVSDPYDILRVIECQLPTAKHSQICYDGPSWLSTWLALESTKGIAAGQVWSLPGKDKLRIFPSPSTFHQ